MVLLIKYVKPSGSSNVLRCLCIPFWVFGWFVKDISVKTVLWEKSLGKKYHKATVFENTSIFCACACVSSPSVSHGKQTSKTVLSKMLQ